MKAGLPFLLLLLLPLATVTGDEVERNPDAEVQDNPATEVDDGEDEGTVAEDHAVGDGFAEEAGADSGERRSGRADFIYGAGSSDGDDDVTSGTWIERGFTLFGYLLMIGAIIVASLWLFRNHPRFRGERGTSSRSLRVAETRPLGQKQFLAIVECDERRILVGFSPGRMDYLCNLSQATKDTPNEEAVHPSEVR